MKCTQTEIILDFKCNYSPVLLILETEAESSIPSILCENLKSTVGIAVSLVKLTLKQQKGLFLCFQTRNLIKKKATFLHIGCAMKGKLTPFFVLPFICQLLATGFCESQSATTLSGAWVIEAESAAKRGDCPFHRHF